MSFPAGAGRKLNDPRGKAKSKLLRGSGMSSKVLALKVFTILMVFWALPARAGTCTPGAIASAAARNVTISSCKYVDYASGSDANSGDTESAPWKHMPGMVGTGPSGTSSDSCASNCASFSPSAGTGIILKGGTVWPNTVFPISFSFGGTGSTASNFGCAGTGCIYVGIDATWNHGTINSIATIRDFGGCPSSGVSVSFSGGGGSGGAATANMVGGQANFVDTGYVVGWYTITNAGSGYTSNPTVTVSGSGCRQISAVADVQRAIFDFGGPGTEWNQSSNGGIGPIVFNGNYTVVDNIEVRNMAFNTGVTQYMAVLTVNGNWSTASNNFVHNFAPFGNASTTNPESFAGIGAASATGEIAYNFINNAEPSFVCQTNLICSWGEFGMTNGVNIHHNRISFGSWATKSGCSSAPCTSEVFNNEIWACTAQNVGGHLNLFYLGGDGWTLYIYNNIAHDCVGSTSQLTSGYSVGSTAYYIFNNVTWNSGSGGAVFGPDLEGGSSPTVTTTYNFWNNTSSGGSPYATEFNDSFISLGGGSCSGVAPKVSLNLYNNQAITDQSQGHWLNMQCSGINQVNGVSNPTNTTADSANLIQSLSTVNGQGYTIANGFAPSASTNSTVTFSGTDLTSTAQSTADLGALQADILNNPRPSLGAWNSGAYQFMGGNTGAPPAAPTDLQASIQ